MKTYKLTDEDIQFMAEQIVRLQQKHTDIAVEAIAQEIMACLIISDARNERT